MKTGDIIIVAYPFTGMQEEKARPAVIVTQSKESFDDVIVCMITSVVTDNLKEFQIFVKSTELNNLKADSIIRVSRVSTIEKKKILATIGTLNSTELELFKKSFKTLID